jgi:cytochrome b6-f complex iron-sulfur subunit
MSNCCCSKNASDNALQGKPTETSRRTFFGAVAGVAVALVAWPKMTFAAAAKKVAVPLASAEKLQKVGGYMVTKIKDKDLLLIRDGEKSVHAFEAKCPHEKCPLTYSADEKKVKCPCHKASFDLTGKVLAGPPPRPLESYPATLEGGKILIALP